MADMTQQQQDLITELKAKVQFLENKLVTLQNQKTAALQTEEDKYKTAMQTVCDTYDSQISTLQSDIVTVQNQLKEVK
jgi:chaperonin cofactor prefoldin